MRALGLAGTVVAVTVGSGALTSCGGGSGNDHEAIVAPFRAYADADAANDGTRVCAVLSTAAAGAVGSTSFAGKHRGGSCEHRYAAYSEELHRDPAADGPLTAFARRLRDTSRNGDALTVKIHGDAATVTVAGFRAFRTDSLDYVLRREDGAWRVDGLPETATLR